MTCIQIFINELAYTMDPELLIKYRSLFTQKTRQQQQQQNILGLLFSTIMLLRIKKIMNFFVMFAVIFICKFQSKIN